MITCDQFVSEGKGTNAYTIGCFSRFMFTSNNDNCLKVNPDSRRYWVVDVSSELKGDATFFNELSAHMDDPHTRHEFYSLLKARDIDHVDWIKDRPITEGYEEMAALNMPYEHQFIKAMVVEAAEQQGVRSCTLDVLRDEFRAWQVRAHGSERQHDTSALKFAHKISKLAWNPERHTGFRGIVKSRDMYGVKYAFDAAELVNEMRAKRWITQDDCIKRV
jgi:hypothetical protein